MHKEDSTQSKLKTNHKHQTLVSPLVSRLKFFIWKSVFFLKICTETNMEWNSWLTLHLYQSPYSYFVCILLQQVQTYQHIFPETFQLIQQQRLAHSNKYWKNGFENEVFVLAATFAPEETGPSLPEHQSLRFAIQDLLETLNVINIRVVCIILLIH